MRSSNYFAENWGQTDSYVRSNNQHGNSRYDLLPEKRVIKKTKMRNSQVNKSMDTKTVRIRHKARKVSRSPFRDDELERAQERIKTIQMISLLREEKLKAEFKTKEHQLKVREKRHLKSLERQSSPFASRSAFKFVDYLD